MVALVRRRRELNARLQKLAGGSGEGLVRQEAKRTRASVVSIEVLEAAVTRAERVSARTDLETAHDEGEPP
jgi:hypothetical protein